MSKLKVDLNYEYVPGEIEEEIITEAAAKLISKLNGERDRTIDERIIELVDKNLSEELAPILKDIPNHQITKSCGFSKTEKVTVQEYILESAAKWLTTTVDEKGREPSYSSNAKMKRIEYIVRSVLDEEISDLKKEVREESKKYLEEYDKKVRDIIAENVQDIVTKLNNK